MNRIKRKTAGINNGKLNYKELLVLLPVLFIVTCYPYIMGFKSYNTYLSKFSWFPSEDSYFDLFLYYKQIYFLVAAFIMLLVVLYYAYKQNFKVKLPFIFVPIGLYALLALISTVTSKHSFYGYRGMFEQFESVFVLLGYSITVVYIFIVIKKIESIELIFTCLTISVIGFGILGLTQILGFDFLTSEFGLKLILPRVLWNDLGAFKLAFHKVIYLTLYNPNYVGVYTSFILPIYLTLLIVKGKEGIIYYCLPIASLILCLIGSKSASGIVGIVIALMAAIILLRQFIFQKKWMNIAAIILIVICVVFIVVPKFETIKRLLSPQKVEVRLTDIQTEERIIFAYNKSILHIDYFINENNQFVLELEDQDNRSVEYVQDLDSLIYKVTDERFTVFSITPILYDEQIFIKVAVGSKEWLFTKENNTYYYYNRFGKLDKIEKAESVLFTEYERFASGRGYIWSRTIPLLKRYMVLGSGADTFAIAFPQKDYLNLYNYGFGEHILTKPHSLYLQIGVQTGVVSLIAFIVMFGIYFISSVKVYIKSRFCTDLQKYGVACFVGTISYIVLGISNDSSITVAPIFWTIIGLGIKINRLIKDELDK